jgi:hypothetical protein
MAELTLPHRNPRSRDRTRRDILSSSAIAPTTFEQHASYLTTLSAEQHSECGTRRASIPLA